ncbi:MAG: hypothetical protein O7B35_13705 [Deltaproteobacteria bacterium]|nr:hypothetical protein [Deltaproteobacteria bacterium]
MARVGKARSCGSGLPVLKNGPGLKEGVALCALALFMGTSEFAFGQLSKVRPGVSPAARG